MTAKKVTVRRRIPPTWAKVIDAAEKRGSFTAAEIKQSACWATCAVGERVSTRTETFNLAAKRPQLWLNPSASNLLTQVKRIERVLYENPDDYNLYDAGMDFYGAVEDGRFANAREALARVDAFWAKRQAATKAATK